MENNITLQNMSYAYAEEQAQKAREAGTPRKVFDWRRAKRILSTRKNSSAEFGFAEIWESNRKIIRTEYGFLFHDSMNRGALWSTPVLVYSENGIDLVIPCWLYERDSLPCTKALWEGTSGGQEEQEEQEDER